MGLLASIGIVKGQPFAPGAHMKAQTVPGQGWNTILRLYGPHD